MMRPADTFCLRFSYRKNPRRPDSPGTLCCRVTLNKARASFLTSVCLREADWDAPGQQVIGGTAVAAHNRQLRLIGACLREVFRALRAHDRQRLTSAAIVDGYRNPKRLAALLGQKGGQGA